MCQILPYFATGLKHLSFILLAWCLPTLASARADEPPRPSLDSALRVIEHFEGRIERIQFESRGTSGKFADPNNVAHIDLSANGEANYSLALELNTGRIKLREWGFGKWVDGAAPFIGYNCTIAFDGKVQRELTIQRGGRTAPEEGEVQGHGEITATRDYDKKGRPEHLIPDWLSGTGLDYFPPRFFGKRFSVLIRETNENGKMSLKQNSTGLWVFTLSGFDELSAGCDVHVTYDPARGAITGADWDSKKGVWRRIAVYLTKLPNDFWVPERIDLMNLIDKTITRWRFSKIAINQPLEDEVFSLTFPPGTQVVDHIEKKRYMIGRGAVNDEAAILSYAQMHGLRLTEDPPLGDSVGWTRKRLLLVAGVVSPGLALLVYLLFIRRKGTVKTMGKGTSLVLLCVLLNLSFAQAQEMNDKGEWIKREKNGKTTYLSQCGWNISMLTLECFGIRSHLPHMAETVPPTEVGVNFADVQTWLEANGLKCVPRKNVDLKAVEKHLAEQMMAIYVIKTSAKRYNHFVGVLNHPRLGKVFMNPRQPPVALGEIADDPSFQPLDGLALFVSRDSERKKQADEVSVTPSSIDLGKFAINGQDAGNAVYHSVSLQNNSALPVHIPALTSVCGCLGSTWKGGVLKAGETKEVQFYVVKGGWRQVGVGEKTITIGFADGSETLIRWKGEAYVDPDGSPVESGVKRLVVTPNPLYLTLEESEQQQEGLKAEARIWFGEAEAARKPQAALSSSCKWLSCSFTEDKADNGIMVVSVMPKALPDAGRTFEGKIKVRAGDEISEVRVVLTRRGFFQCVPDVVTCKPGSGAETVIKLVKEEKAKHSFGRIEVIEKPKGSSIEVQKVEPANACLCLRTESIEEGSHFVTVKVTDETGRSSTGRVLVMARK